MKNKLLVFLIVVIPVFTFAQTGTGIVNNGAKIIIDEGAKIGIEGDNADYVNYTDNTDGRIDISGTLEIAGDWLNNASTPDVFVNYGENAQVIFNGSSEQAIGGDNPTNFYNLSLKNDLTLNTQLNILQTLSMENSLLNLGNQ